MKASSLAVVAGASSVLAQGPAPPTQPIAPTSITISPEEIAQYALGLLSNSCRSTVEQLVINSSSPIHSCLHVESLLPAIMTNGSVIPYVDEYLADVCYSNPCSAAALNYTAQQIVGSCADDLTMIGISNQTVYDIVELYPLAREIACLKTTDPSSTNSTMTFNTTSYNTTNGTFCITDLATELQSYLGANLTNAYIDTVALGGNSTALQLLANISAAELCNECIFAAVDLIESEYPQLANYSVGQNKTINQWLTGTCPAYNISGNGTLPSNITEAALNSTFPETVIAGNATYTPGPDAVAAPTLNLPDMGAAMTMSGAMGAPSAMGMPSGPGAPGVMSAPSGAAPSAMSAPSGAAAPSVMSMASGAAAPSAGGPPAGPSGSAPSAPAGSAAAKRTVGSMEEKKRWIGQW